MRFGVSTMRFAKAAALLVALASSIYADNEKDWDHLLLIQAICLVLIIGRIFWEDRKDPVLRIISGTYFLCSINNLFDETIGDPLTFKMTEKMFALGLVVSVTFAIYKVKNGRHIKHKPSNN